jgi:DNA mismatch repair protein MutS
MNAKNQKSTKSETPLMSQYNAIKAQHRDAVLFFRMGDFFEMFNEDAKIGAKVLGITLTSRGHGKAGNVPLAGFPHHALDGYLAKMIRAGYRVAICEQTEDPKLAKGIVKRDVIQVVTPGTVTDEKLLESAHNNYLSALCLSDNLYGMATVDVSTGEFTVTEFEAKKLIEEIHSIGPSEIIISEEQEETFNNAINHSQLPILITKREGWIFSRDYGYEILTKHFGTSSLKGYGCEDLDAGLSAAGAVLTYLQDTQKTSLAHIQKISTYTDDDFMMLDPSTRRNLEITSSMMGDNRAATLLSIIDKTQTPMGSRTLSAWIQRPLKKTKPIRNRLNSIQALLDNKSIRRKLTTIFKGMNDLERLIAKVVMKRANPRDLMALKKGLERIPDMTTTLKDIQTDQIKKIIKSLKPCKTVTQKIEQALVEDPPAVLANGNIIKKGYHKELDELRKIAFSGKDWIAQMQKSERDKTAIPSLKVGYNKVFGYYIEVTKPHLSKIPEEYIRKQTLVNAERFITPQLKEMEEKILHAEEKINSLEQELFDKLRSIVAKSADVIQENGRLIGQLDSLLSLANVAEEYRYIKPEVHEGSDIYIEEGRHPVVEQWLPAGEPFIPNDVILNNHEDQILIITGPNMAGKSTYIRQVGLIVLLAQIGSFVPAKSASIGLVDRIFTRVGAQDNVAGGESTFLVEMNEAANILNNATPKSLILLDEIGRGTSTFDGLSIAWAVAEYLHDNPKVQAKTLFATHYHELTELSLILNRVKNYNVSVKEWGDHIVFLRKIVPGGCDHSYGIQVARLAGLPKEVISRAKEILSNLEANELTPYEMPKLAVGPSQTKKVAQPQLNIFAEEEKRIREELKKLDLDNMTPMEAIKKMEELKKWLSDD